MCGIAGIFHVRNESLREESRPTAPAELAARLRAMLEPIRHRGDADHGIEIEVGNDWACGTNRLAILGRDHGRQPIRDPEGRYRVVYNGEIYNHEALRAELRDAGLPFTTATDTEVVLNAWRAWGAEMVHRLDGMFAFVIHDQETGEVFAGRDPLGIKPLYWARHGAELLFASEQKCFLPLAVEPEVFPPGHRLAAGRLEPYWRLRLTDDATETGNATAHEAPEEIVRELRRLFMAAVEKRVATDLPVAVSLSGGLDSTAVLHFARQFHPRVTAFTIGAEGAADIEAARLYCRDHDVPHRVCALRRDDLLEVLPHVVRAAELFEELDVMETCVASIVFRAMHREGFKIALCGEGSDELFAGYDVFRSHPDPHALMRYRLRNLHRTDLQRVDRASMMHSVEARVPFLDRDLVEWVTGLPMRWKWSPAADKRLLRRALAGDLPAEIVERPKEPLHRGTGLGDVLCEHARQDAELPADLVARLGLHRAEERFFLRQYLDAGFPPPRERHRLPDFDLLHRARPSAAVLSGPPTALAR